MFTMVTVVALVNMAIIIYTATLFGLGNTVSVETMVTLITLVAFVVVTMVTLARRVIMRSLHDVHEMNAYGAGYVCLSVRPSVGMSA
jgi:hypothetical protein